MSTKRSSSYVMNKPEEDLSVPPGFASLTSFTLKRKLNCLEDNDKPVGGESRTGSFDAPLRDVDIKKFKASFRKRPWMHCDQVDHVPEGSVSDRDELSAASSLPQKAPVSACLPEGVVWGCANCHDCLKVTARWQPDGSCLPVLCDAPVFHPTEEEFKDTLKYIAEIRPKADKYGICSIVPPPSWRPPCLLEDSMTWGGSKFTSHFQKIDELRTLYVEKKLSRLHEQIENKVLGVVGNAGLESCDEGVVDSAGAKSADVRSEFEQGPAFTLESFKKCADDFKIQYFCDYEGPIAGQDQRGPVASRIEGEYWRIIEKANAQVKVLSAHLRSQQQLGSGFPASTNHPKHVTNYEEYVESGWNLNNIFKLPGSLLPFGCYRDSVISIPQLFIGMCFSSQCWRTEDHHLYSVSYLHLGEPKVCYGIPWRYYFKFLEVVKKLYPKLTKHPKLLHELLPQLPPMVLASEGIPVYRCVQNPKEFVVIFPGAHHTEFSCGFNCGETVCFAPFDWLPHGQNMVELYTDNCLKTSISHDKLLIEGAMEAVAAQWESFALKNKTVANQRWVSACGKDGILTRAVKTRVRDEGRRVKHLCDPTHLGAFDGLNAATKLECTICSYDLYLSAVNCSCCPNKYSCLPHSKLLCPCPWTSKRYFVRYEITELDLLVEALEGNLKAMHVWAKRLGSGIKP